MDLMDTPISSIPPNNFDDAHLIQSDLDSLANSDDAMDGRKAGRTSMEMGMVKIGIEIEDEEASYEDPDSDGDGDEDDDSDIDAVMEDIENDIHEQMHLGTNVAFGESGLIIECIHGNPDFGYYEFSMPKGLLQGIDIGGKNGKQTKLTFNHLYRQQLNLSRSEPSDLTSIFSQSNGAQSPLSLLSSKPTTILSHNNNLENPFQVTDDPVIDQVYQRQEYQYHYRHFFTGNVYLTTQQLRFAKINPKVPEFMKLELQRPIDIEEDSEFDDYKSPTTTPFTPQSILDMTPNRRNKHKNKKRNRSQNIRQTAQRNTDFEGDPSAKVNENKDLYDEDKKLAALLQELSSMNYHFVPNGLLTHPQFVEFIDSCQIYNYDKHVLKHMFRYLYTEELPPTLPPPPIIEFNENEEDNYNNVNGMYVAYSECIGYEYDEILDLIEPYKKPKKAHDDFDDLLTTMVVERLQNIYQTLKFDDLDAHPNQFLYQQSSFQEQQQHTQLNGDELKENVFNYFDEQREKDKQAQAAMMPIKTPNDSENRLKSILHNYASSANTAISTMRSTQSETLTYNNNMMFRQSIISQDSLLLANALKSPNKLNKEKEKEKFQFLIFQC